jgi:hypothetical protein
MNRPCMAVVRRLSSNAGVSMISVKIAMSWGTIGFTNLGCTSMSSLIL